MSTPRVNCSASFTNCRIIGSIFATPTATLAAIHRCPALPIELAKSPFAVESKSASGTTIIWFFAPPKQRARFPSAVERPYTIFAIFDDPTNAIAFIFGWSQIPSTISREPLTTWNTSSGNPASLRYSAIFSADKGVCSEGFNIKQLPVVIARGIIHNGTIAGKLKGVIPATTPNGS